MAAPYDPTNPTYDPGDPNNPNNPNSPNGLNDQYNAKFDTNLQKLISAGQVDAAQADAIRTSFRALIASGNDYDTAFGSVASQYGWNNRAPAPPTTGPTTAPTTGPTTGTPTPTGLTYDQFSAQAKAYYQSKWNTALTDPVMAQAKTDLGSTSDPTYRYSDGDLTKVKAWIDAHNPGGAPGGGDPTKPNPNNGPTYNAPNVNTPAPFQGPPAFNYQPFQAPGLLDVLNDPGYQTDLMRGTQALDQSAASRGVLNTGGHLTDVQAYGQQLGSAEYQNLYNRSASTYQTNRQNALDQYNTNYQTQYTDPYNINYQDQFVDPFQMNSQNAQNTYQAQNTNWQTALGYDQHNKDQNLYYQTQATDLQKMYDWYNTLFQYQKTQDDFNNKYKLLGLA